MRSAAVGGLCWNGAVSSSSSSSMSGSSSTRVSSKQQCSSCVSARDVRVQAVSLQQQLPKDPPSAYHALRQQPAHSSSNSNNSSSSYQDHLPGRKQQQQRWPRPVDDLCKAVSKSLKQAQDTAAVLRVVQHHAGQFNAINTALAYAQLARHLRFETGSSRAAALQHSDYATLQGLAVQQAGQLNPRQISMVLTSLAWMQCPAQDGCAADPAAKQQLVAPQAAAASSAGSHTSSKAADDGSHRADSSAVCLQQQQQQALLLDLLSQRLLSLLDTFEPEDTCHCLWALTKLGALQEQLLAAVTEHGLTAGWLHMLTAKPLSSLLWVHAQAHLQRTQLHAQQQGSQQAQVVLQPCSTDTAFLQDMQDLHAHQMVAAVMQEVSQPGFLSTWTPQELSMLLWSCAVLGVPVQQQQQPQQQSIIPQQDRVQQQGESSRVHRHGVPPAGLPVAVLQEVCQLARQHVVQFTPQGVAMVCWSLSHLLTSSGSASEPVGASQQVQQHASVPSAQPQHLQQAVLALFDAFTAAAAVRLQYYKPQEVCNIFTACTRLQLLPAGLRQSVQGYVSTHAHLLGCRDVTELLLAAAQTPQGPWQQQLGPGQQQGVVGLGPVAVRALLHRTGQLVQELNSFQVAAAAWACVRLAQLQDAAARRASTSSRGGNLNSGSSTLQEECMGMASVLLAALGARAQQSAAWPDLGAAVSGAGRASENLHGQDVAASWSSMAGAGAGDIKQTVALAWALAAASEGQHMPGADTDALQQQHCMLLGTVLQQLQQGVQSCDSAKLVQVLCVLERLCPAVLRSAAGQHALQHAPAHAGMQRVLIDIQDTAVARLLPLVPRLTSSDAATVGWAAAKLYVLLRGVQYSGIASQQQPAGASSSPATAPAALLSEVLTQLHLRQQLATLSGQSVSALLWSCRAVGWVPPAAIYLELLTAADARLLQLQQHQQVSVLQSVAAGIAAGLVNPQAAHGVALPADASLVQQLHRQTVRLVSGLTEQLQMQLHQQALQLDWQLRNPAGASPAASYCGLAPQSLITLVAACGSLKILQGSQLLHQVVEVWQLLLQQGTVSADHSLLMLSHLADVLQDSPIKQWHTQVLQQQVTQSAADRPGLLPWLLHHAVNALAADLAAYSPSRPQQALAPQTLVLALRVFSKLRYQAPGQVLGPLMQQLQSALPVLAEADIVSALTAAAQLAVSAHSFTAAVVKELARKQLPRTHPAAGAPAAAQQRALQQQELAVSQAGRPATESLTLLWAVLASGAWAGQGGRGISKSTGRLLVKLAHKASGVPDQQLLQKPEMLLMQQQAWRMLRRLQQYAAVRRVLHYCGLSLPRKLLLPRQLNRMTQVLLPRNIGAHAAQQALLQLLFAGQQQQGAVLQQHLCVLQQSGQHLQPEQLRMVLPLLPAWLQYQLQRRAQQQLAQQFVRAQFAAGFAAAAAKLKVTPSGEVVLVLSPQQHRHITQQQRKQQSSWLKQLRRQHRLGQQQQPSDSQAGAVAISSGPCKGVAVVLEVPSDVSVNTGRLLGRGLARDALLQAEGYHVMSLPVQNWLPDFVLRHQHSTLLQEYQDQPMRQQHVQKLIWKRLNKLRALRRRQVAQLVEALYLCSPTCSTAGS